MRRHAGPNGRPGVRFAQSCGALALVTAACTISSTPAQAGAYEVVACGGAAGGAQNAFVAAADPGMAAYTMCPNTPSNPVSGIVTRASATAGPGSVPHYAGAYQIFEAPPGASLSSVSFDVAAIRLANHWTTGLIAYDGSFNTGDHPYGCYAGSPGCGIGTLAFVGPVTAGLNGHAKFRLETRCGNPGGCDISASGYSLGMRALFSVANVRVQVQDFTTPSVTPLGGSLFSGGWLRGVHGGTSTESDNVGVMVNRTSIDGQVVYAEDFRDGGWPGHVRCDFTRSRPCHDVVGAGSLVNTRSLTDGPHVLRVEAIDAAGNYGSAAFGVKIDNTPPLRVNAHVEGGEGWRTQNGFAVRWPLPAGQAAPVTTAHYQLCSVEAAPRCLVESRSGAGIERLDDIAVPAAGEYTLTAWLEDEAGNVNAEAASDPVRLRFDDVPPGATFEPLDESDPTRLEVRTSDSASGVTGGVIEIRRAGWRQWHALSTSFGDGRLIARVDDLELPDDRYELRAKVRDRAGNERTTHDREDGARMALTLPLRAASRIVLRKARTTLRGLLRTAADKPLAGNLLSVSEQPRTGGGFRRIASVRSDASGRFRQHLGGGSSRTIQVRFEGTQLIKPTLGTLTIRVPARTTIEASRRFLRNGQTVRLGGRLKGRPIPNGGKLIDLQAHYRGKWRTFATPRSDGSGRWSFRYTFEVTSGRVRYRFRARIRREAAYPYELGYSRVVAVIVRGR